MIHESLRWTLLAGAVVSGSNSWSLPWSLLATKLCSWTATLTQTSRANALCLGPQSQGDSIQITLSGRRQEGFDAAVAGRPELKGARFCSCDIDDPASLEAALQARFMHRPSTVIVNRMRPFSASELSWRGWHPSASIPCARPADSDVGPESHGACPLLPKLPAAPSAHARAGPLQSAAPNFGWGSSQAYCKSRRLAGRAQGADLVLHAAGPFQRRTECNVLEACIAARVPYIDICDDADYSQRAKALHQKCAAAAIAPGLALGKAAASVLATTATAEVQPLLSSRSIIVSSISHATSFVGVALAVAGVPLFGSSQGCCSTRPQAEGVALQGRRCWCCVHHHGRHLPGRLQHHGGPHDLHRPSGA